MSTLDLALIGNSSYGALIDRKASAIAPTGLDLCPQLLATEAAECCRHDKEIARGRAKADPCHCTDCPIRKSLHEQTLSM